MALYGAEGYAFYFILLEKIFRMENGRITCGKPIEKAGLKTKKKELTFFRNFDKVKNMIAVIIIKSNLENKKGISHHIVQNYMAWRITAPVVCPFCVLRGWGANG